MISQKISWGQRNGSYLYHVLMFKIAECLNINTVEMDKHQIRQAVEHELRVNKRVYEARSKVFADENFHAFEFSAQPGFVS